VCYFVTGIISIHKAIDLVWVAQWRRSVQRYDLFCITVKIFPIMIFEGAFIPFYTLDLDVPFMVAVNN
jgi:hypothetical protein